MGVPVLSVCRGQGIGTRFITMAKLTLGVAAKNPAKHLYQRFAFVEEPHSTTVIRMVLLLFCRCFGGPHYGCGGTKLNKSLL